MSSIIDKTIAVVSGKGKPRLQCRAGTRPFGNTETHSGSALQGESLLRKRSVYTYVDISQLAVGVPQPKLRYVLRRAQAARYKAKAR